MLKHPKITIARIAQFVKLELEDQLTKPIAPRELLRQVARLLPVPEGVG